MKAVASNTSLTHTTKHAHEHNITFLALRGKKARKMGGGGGGEGERKEKKEEKKAELNSHIINKNIQVIKWQAVFIHHYGKGLTNRQSAL